MDKIEHFRSEKDMKINDIVKGMKATAFNARRLAEAIDVTETMVGEKECTVFFGLAGAMVPAGMKQIVIDMIKDGWIDVVVSTGANLTHDLVEALGYNHYQGSEKESDTKLNEKNINRMFNVYMPNDVYEGLEKFCYSIFDNMPKQISIKEFLWELGKNLKEESILKVCADMKIPIFCPAIADSAIGLMVWGYNQKAEKENDRIVIDACKDMNDIISIAWDAKKKGVFYVGGGVPKNYIQQSMQFSNPADYGVQIKIDPAAFGGSSGAPLGEGVSWGKMSTQGTHIDVICDATIALPIMHVALKDRLSE